MDSFSSKLFACLFIGVSNCFIVRCEDSKTSAQDNRIFHLIILVSVMGYLLLVSLFAIVVWYCIAKPKSNQQLKPEPTNDTQSNLQFTFVTYPAQPERYTCALENNFSVEMDEYAPATDVSSLSTDDRRSVVNKETYVDLNNMYMHFDNAAYVE